MITSLLIACLITAGVAAGLFLVNLLVYRRLPEVPSHARSGLPGISVLIPARNEEANIAAALESVLANTGVEFEVIVMDDGSTDATADIVRSFSGRDARAHLAQAPTLPSGWCGKTHACQTLAGQARYPILLFLDADVRLAGNALRRISQAFSQANYRFLSGVPRQLTGTFSEKLLIPLIHFVLLGYLPMPFARVSRKPAFGAGCGQLVAVDARAYFEAGGHEAIKASLHDGLTLSRAFRRAGFLTGLFDATDLAVCRMYQTNAQVWRGLEKNATEGIGAPGTILPMSTLLLIGQVLPWILLPFVWASAPHLTGLAVIAVLLSLLPRLAGCIVFRQPLISALLQPLGIFCLLGIQWVALVRKFRGQTSNWKGRDYGAVSLAACSASRWNLPRAARLVGLLALITLALAWAWGGEAETRIAAFRLPDQFGNAQSFDCSSNLVTVVTVADRKGHEQIAPWVEALRHRYGVSLPIEGIANVTGVPATFRPLVRKQLRKTTHPIMMDWQGGVVQQFAATQQAANIYVLNRKGEILQHSVGDATAESLQKLFGILEKQGVRPHQVSEPNAPVR